MKNNNLYKEHRFVPVGMFSAAGKGYSGYPVNVTKVNDDGSVMGTYNVEKMNIVQQINAMFT